MDPNDSQHWNSSPAFKNNELTEHAKLKCVSLPATTTIANRNRSNVDGYRPSDSQTIGLPTSNATGLN